MAKTNEKGEIINLGERITVYATAKSVSRKEGEEFLIHPLAAENLIKLGRVTKTAPKTVK
jgi:hypothetical protein